MFREDKLKVKALNSFRDYLQSNDCTQYRKARNAHKQNLIKKSIAGFRVRIGLSKLRRTVAAKHKVLTQRTFFAEWVRKKQSQENHRLIMENMGANKTVRVF